MPSFNSDALLTDRIIAQANNIISEPAIRESGLPINEYSAMLDHLYVPNIRNGEVIIPRKYRGDEDALPFVPIGHDVLSFSGVILDFSSGQFEKSKIRLLEWGLDDDTAKSRLSYFSQILREISFDKIQLGDRSAKTISAHKAFMNQQMGHISSTDGEKSIRVHGKPIVLFKKPSKRNSRPNYRAGVLLLHELTHSIQLINLGVMLCKDEDDYVSLGLERELEAFHIEATIDSILMDASVIDKNSVSRFARTIEDARSKENENQDNPFRLTPKLRTVLAELGYTG